MKDKKNIWLYILVGVVVLGGAVWYLVWGRTKVTEEDGFLKIEKDNIVTETTTFIQDELSYEITKNRVTRNAVVKISYPISDDTESMDFLGEEVTMVPFTVNFSCAMFNASFFDIDAFNETVASFNDEDTTTEPITKNEGFLEKLGEYEITEFSINFFDSEDQGKIAKCSSKEKGNENIKFEVFRDYTGLGSFFGVEIGVFENTEDEGI